MRGEPEGRAGRLQRLHPWQDLRRFRPAQRAGVFPRTVSRAKPRLHCRQSCASAAHQKPKTAKQERADSMRHFKHIPDSFWGLGGRSIGSRQRPGGWGADGTGRPRLDPIDRPTTNLFGNDRKRKPYFPRSLHSRVNNLQVDTPPLPGLSPHEGASATKKSPGAMAGAFCRFKNQRCSLRG